MNYIRAVGSNIKTLLVEKYGSIELVAENTGYSVKDLKRIFEGRIAITPFIVNDLFEGSKDLVTKLSAMGTTNSTYIDCVGNFSNSDNEDKILNLIDDFIFLHEQLDD